jgi:hypothetical protein
MQLSIRLNDEELEDHEWLKRFFGFNDLHGEDSQTIKQAERVARNVLQRIVGVELQDIFQRKSKDELSRKRLEISQNANKCNAKESENTKKSTTEAFFDKVLNG